MRLTFADAVLMVVRLREGLGEAEPVVRLAGVPTLEREREGDGCCAEGRSTST